MATVSRAENISTSFTRSKHDSSADQIELIKEKYADPIGIMTISSGAPVSHSDATNSLNSILTNNDYFIDSLTHFNRERIPERVVHAKGGGAFGYFEVTHDISYICKAEMFSKIGRKTPVSLRFSSLIPEKGGSDVSRDARGFAVKFYTKDGNFDIVGLNIPIFVLKDPLKFPNFVHAAKQNPSTNLRDYKTFWDFTTLNPESFFHLLFQFGDRGIPASYVNMPGFSIHTYQVENEHGEKHFVRFHFIPDAGIKNLTTEEASRIAAEDLDYFNRILYRDIANREFPSWTVSIQVLTLKDVKKSRYDVFDVTRLISLKKHPLKEVGKLILDKNPKNYFAEIEQLAFCPGNLVPGILGDPSQLFEARRFLYRDAQYYRLGANFNKISINCPYRTKTLTYNRDGTPPVKDNEEDIPNYYPNSFNGPVPYTNTHKSQLISIIENPEPNNFEQASELYVNEMTSDERSRLVTNIVSTLKLSTVVTQKRAVVIFERIHPDLGRRVAQGLKENHTLLGSV
ncbi:catalase-like [Maniola jurtina]|uniref:catalase-like n=1 Tax=Maniola jurtina TaxID=191418 RepID=UPI001E68D56D|nr:catalase-like [Maniola jurtina]